MDETRRIADRVTVLRDGRLVGGGTVAETSDQQHHQHDGRTGRRDPLPQDRDVSRERRSCRCVASAGQACCSDISFDLRQGEVLGLSGLVGAGRTEIARCVFGADHYDSGTITLDGQEVTIRSPEQAVGLGIGYVPEDRKRQGLFPEMSVRDNIAMSVIHRMTRAGIVDRAAVREVVASYRERLQVRPAHVEIAVNRLSGGNQQKVALAKWLALKPKVLILDEPTRGIDVGAKAEVHALIDELAHEGIGIILISSELPEVLNMSDRILVVAEGEIVGELSRAEATQERCLELASSKASAGRRPRSPWAHRHERRGRERRARQRRQGASRAGSSVVPRRASSSSSSRSGRSSRSRTPGSSRSTTS